MALVDFTRILAWQKGHAFVLLTYQKCHKIPSFEKNGLISQFTRAAVSITANIAEGVQKVGKADKLRFLNISQGSLAECQNYIFLCKDLGYFDLTDSAEMFESIRLASFFLDRYIQGIEADHYEKDI